MNVWGYVFPTFPKADTQISLAGLAKGDYFIRVGYMVQWYWNQSTIGTQRLINREPRLYQGPHNRLLVNPYLTISIR